MSEFRILVGDCLTVMPTLDADSVDAIVTDPPYGLAFMGKSWDHGVPGEPFWREALRVAKPGAHLLAFGGTRTFHRLTCAIEDAGWEIRDCIMWVYGSGFPKSLDVSKAIDKAERGEMVRRKLLHFAETRGVDGRWLEEHGVASASSFTDWTTGGHVPSDKNWRIACDALGVTPDEEAEFERAVVCRGAGGLGRHAIGDHTWGFRAEYDKTAPATKAAARWHGWGTALKPAWEPIIVARKPLAGTVAQNVQQHGTGALNIDACRIVTGDSLNGGAYASGGRKSASGSLNPSGMNRPGAGAGREYVQPDGRWPANLIHDGSAEATSGFPAEAGGSGIASGPSLTGPNQSRALGDRAGVRDGFEPAFYGDSGSAARFFYCAKADKSDRGDGNRHPTVKPLALMGYLCKLVAPVGALILDPFCGSGSTGVAATAYGQRFIGIEREAEYAALAEKRIREARGLFAK